MSAPYIGGSMHFNFFLASVTELPAITAGIWIYNRLEKNSGNAIDLYVRGMNRKTLKASIRLPILGVVFHSHSINKGVRF